MPGQHPNDYHLGKDGVMQPGLGKDESTESQRARAKAASADGSLQADKEALRVAEAALTEQKRAYAKREQEVTEQQRAEQELAALKLAAAAEEPAVSKTKG